MSHEWREILSVEWARGELGLHLLDQGRFSAREIFGFGNVTHEVEQARKFRRADTAPS